MSKTTTHGSLFSGIGGFDLAAEWMGWNNVFHCEKNEFCNRILNYYWPYAKSYTDIKQTDFNIWRGDIDIVTGGFPCQPYSQAGKRKGKADDRHLWPEMLRAIREIQPGFVVGENVYGLLNWSGGMVFDEVQTDLENEGYEVTPYILPACAKNAPHKRDRIWFVAYSHASWERRNQREKEIKGNVIPDSTKPVKQRNGISRSGTQIKTGGRNSSANATDAGLLGQEKLEKQTTRIEQCDKGDDSNSHSERQSGQKHRQAKSGQFAEKSILDYWENFPTQSPICSGHDGIPIKLDGITFPKWRNESLIGYGNAIVPQVAYEIFKVIEQLAKTP